MEYERIAKELSRIMMSFFKEKEQLLEKTIGRIVKRLNAGGKMLVFGNGGSASQSQHFSSELVNTFYQERPALAALSLCTDTSALTSIANDSSFEYVFSRQVEAVGREGDIVLGLSTSGDSPNVIQAFKTAKKMGMLTVALTGEGGGAVGNITDILLDVPSKDTPRIQEVHLFLLHALAQEIEKRMF